MTNRESHDKNVTKTRPNCDRFLIESNGVSSTLKNYA